MTVVVCYITYYSLVRFACSDKKLMITDVDSLAQGVVFCIF